MSWLVAPLTCLLPTALARNMAVYPIDVIVKDLEQKCLTCLILVHLTCALTKEGQRTAGFTRKGQTHGNDHVKTEAQYRVMQPQGYTCHESHEKLEKEGMEDSP